MAKTIPLQDTGSLKNELRKYQKGQKLTIQEFNRVARLAYFGFVVLTPLDPENDEVDSYLMYIQPPEGLPATQLDIYEDMPDSITILDGEQGNAIADVIRQGVRDRVDQLQAVNRREFYFEYFYEQEQSGSSGENGDGSS
ncbi:hypothetical protein AN478_04345 [Thiohalorhabdus denitrificans]|uniref:Uncharacterized protein n=1 Tax=Thiohalorhabdus denitrificans TaxID=381306 RepID=A0A0P9C7L2_9GAMM|nr:hypothetical protein [Thiohalorhabdus denitrificans]KPV41140.1 hypothetical protein AN478_04345 [Thiohalorhabdus denitrificans]SCY36992.1 hypothetical protein SAMN05661077_1909 [Thiohalorhabdus denitrificans]